MLKVNTLVEKYANHLVSDWWALPIYAVICAVQCDFSTGWHSPLEAATNSRPRTLTLIPRLSFTGGFTHAASGRRLHKGITASVGGMWTTVASISLFMS